RGSPSCSESSTVTGVAFGRKAGAEKGRRLVFRCRTRRASSARKWNNRAIARQENSGLIEGSPGAARFGRNEARRGFLARTVKRTWQLWNRHPKSATASQWRQRARSDLYGSRAQFHSCANLRAGASHFLAQVKPNEPPHPSPRPSPLRGERGRDERSWSIEPPFPRSENMCQSGVQRRRGQSNHQARRSRLPLPLTGRGLG